MYEIDEELAINSITEYNDKGIDCFVHYEESKELFIIQNKYYDFQTSLNRKEVSDFVTTPLSKLMEGNYKNEELQSIFNKAKIDGDYKIWLHLYVTNRTVNKDSIKS